MASTQMDFNIIINNLKQYNNRQEKYIEYLEGELERKEEINASIIAAMTAKNNRVSAIKEEEREECAKIAENEEIDDDKYGLWNTACWKIADKIRDRG